MLIEPLWDGPLDVIGDVHGELGALQALLARLGYDPRGEHARGRRLVFVGDLCDRGPDSPGVLGLVARLHRRGLAQAVLGNHELNVLRGVRKHGADWFFDAAGQPRLREFAALVEFLRSLPIALERADLRIVHASWHADTIDTLRAEAAEPLSVFERHERETAARARRSGLAAAAEREWRRWSDVLQQRQVAPPLLESLGQHDQLVQMGNPLRIATSGVERLAGQPFFASGRWRMVDRVPWWRDYDDEVPVVFGHYWRLWNPAALPDWSYGDLALFDDVGPQEWLPTRRGARAFCVDYSVGIRYVERRQRPQGPFEGRLVALRWPERELVTDS